MKNNYLFQLFLITLFSLTFSGSRAVNLPSVDLFNADNADATWSYSFYRTIAQGGEGFVADGGTVETTINSVAWTIESDATKYSLYASQGQVIGSSSQGPSYAVLKTTGIPGKIKSVAIKAKAFKDCNVSASVTVGGKTFLAGSDATAQIPTVAADSANFITFTATTDAQGEIAIRFDQTASTLRPIYIKRIDIVYSSNSDIVAVTPPTFSPLGGYSTSSKTVTLTPADPQDVIYFTLDESDPRSSVTRQIYSEPLLIEHTTTVSAAAFRQEQYSTVSQQKYYILHNPDLHFKDYIGSYNAKVGDEGVFVEANNPYNLPLYWESSVESVATVDGDGTVHCHSAGTTEISFYFDGDDDYVAGEGHYTLHVAENLPLSALFAADESQTTYYSMGWDSEQEAATWDYSRENSGYYSWHLEENPPYRSQPSFESIDANSKQSLCIRRGTSKQNELAVSPTLLIEPSTTLEFYACFQSVFLVYDDWKFYIIDEDNDEIAETMSAFLWSQQNEFTGPAWQKFSFDLSAYAGKNLSFAFLYNGPDGEDLAIDGFRLMKPSEENGGKITINEGEAVHFRDRSTGNPTSWQWTFEGGTPSESNEQNPTVVYQTGGQYRVTLTVTDDNGDSDTFAVDEYVNVITQAPHALIGMPTEGYLSPWTAVFIAPNTEVTYHDLSSGNPTSWQWTFEGATPSESSEQNPTVVYKEEGLYGLTLEVSNSSGSTSDFMKDAVQVGGSQYVWNIGLDEYDKFAEIALSYFGFYGGSNYLGMERFAEHFDAPAVPVEIDGVQIYFYSTETVSPDADITVQICKEAADGTPGDILAEASVKASELKYDAKEFVPTDFLFSQTATVDGAFFVVVGPFPNNTTANGSDGISMMAVRRSEGTASAWHLLEDEDPETYQPTGTMTWYQNTDDPTSFCITPHLKYVSASSVDTVATENSTKEPSIYDLQGRRLTTDTSGLPRGIYIINGRKTARR